jgi:hypothetical protein
MIFESYNEFHLGDNLIHLYFLRKLAKAHPAHTFRHRLHGCHLTQLQKVNIGAPELELRDLSQGKIGRNVWKNADGFWQDHSAKNDWADFHLVWFQKLAAEMGLPSPFHFAHDLLFDFPSILSPPAPTNGFYFDVLFVNSQPCSGQFLDYDTDFCLDPLIAALRRNGLSVLCTSQTKDKNCPCTRDFDLDIFQIAHLSLSIPHHVMVATGPMWLTFNVWNTLTTKTRIVMMGVDEWITLPLGIEHVRTRGDAWNALAKKGLI